MERRKKRKYEHIAISPEWHEKVKRVALEQRISMKEVVESALEEALCGGD